LRVLRFQIRLPSGQVDQLNVESERALIGSGAHCEIRLPLDQARVEHVLIELAPQGVFARALNFEPPPTINNIAFTQAPLPPEAVLGVGQVQIYVMAADGAGAGALVQTKQKKSSPIAIFALVMMLGAGGYFLLADDDSSGASVKPKEPPELWGPPIVQCPQAPGLQAAAFARDRLSLADAKRERRPFHVQDGVLSVPLYEQAAACFRAGSDPQSAAAADETAQKLRKDINDDYRTQRVRLEHSLNVEDWSSAQHQVKILRQFTEGKQGDYVTWLSNLDRKLKNKIAAASPSAAKK
jgi:hypothetical protein